MNAKKLIVGNWKMNPSSVDEAKEIISKTRLIAKKLSKTDVVACVPNVFIGSCTSKKDNSVAIGSQDVSVFEGGAYTGESGAQMLYSAGVKYSIIGHSERRKNGDTNEIVSKKLANTLNSGLSAILCVGEEKREESGSHYDIVRDQIKGSIVGLSNSLAKKIIIAYEPVWAIGAVEPMQPKDICEMAIFIRKVFSDIFSHDSAMKVKVLYGGSVNFRNASEIITVGQVDGLLVGRESVNIPGFKELLKAVDSI
jgi:triosephosphate isomerase